MKKSYCFDYQNNDFSKKLLSLLSTKQVRWNNGNDHFAIDFVSIYVFGDTRDTRVVLIRDGPQNSTKSRRLIG